MELIEQLKPSVMNVVREQMVGEVVPEVHKRVVDLVAKHQLQVVAQQQEAIDAIKRVVENPALQEMKQKGDVGELLPCNWIATVHAWFGGFGALYAGACT